MIIMIKIMIMKKKHIIIMKRIVSEKVDLYFGTSSYLREILLMNAMSSLLLAFSSMPWENELAVEVQFLL